MSMCTGEWTQSRFTCVRMTAACRQTDVCVVVVVIVITFRSAPCSRRMFPKEQRVFRLICTRTVAIRVQFVFCSIISHEPDNFRSEFKMLKILRFRRISSIERLCVEEEVIETFSAMDSHWFTFLKTQFCLKRDHQFHLHSATKAMLSLPPVSLFPFE